MSESITGLSFPGRPANTDSIFEATSKALALRNQTNCTSRSERSGTLSSVLRSCSTILNWAVVPEMTRLFERSSTETEGWTMRGGGAPGVARRRFICPRMTFCNNC